MLGAGFARNDRRVGRFGQVGGMGWGNRFQIADFRFHIGHGVHIALLRFSVCVCGVNRVFWLEKNGRCLSV